MSRRFGLRLLLALSPSLALAVPACGDDDAGPVRTDAGTGVGIHPRFDPAADPMPFGAVPWPDDLYLDADGQIDVGTLPGERASAVPEYFDALRVTLHELSGFGTVSPVFFTFDGAVDAASLPAAAMDSVRDDSSVLLIDVDPGSPDAFSRIPVELDLSLTTDPSTGDQVEQLAVRPADGHPLAEGRRYAAVLRSSLHAADGSALVADPDFAAVRDAATRPTEPALAEAHDLYAPVLDSLEGVGVERSDVIGLAVFRTQRVVQGLADARARVWEIAPPTAAITAIVPAGTELDALLGTPAMDAPGLDVEGGVAHGSIGYVVQGTFESPWLLSDTANVHGQFHRDGEGRLVVGRLEAVPFTLVLPRSGDLAALPTVVYQHGLGGERSDVMAFADSLAGAGYAVLAIDAPFHGQRNARARTDAHNRFTDAPTPDGFGDLTGADVVADFAGIFDGAGDLISFHPVYFRDALRQAAVDLMAAVRLVREPDAWTELASADASLASLGFSGAPITFVGNSLGGIIGTLFTASEPEVGASVLAVTGGYIMRLLVDSPPFNMGYLPQLFPLVGVDPEDIDYEAQHPIYYPETAILQTLLDRGDPINYGRALAARRVDVMMFMAKHDETLNNVATESLALAIGAPMVGDEPVYTTLGTTTAPVRDNVTVDGETFTRALFVHEPATHGLLFQRVDQSRWAHPVEPPFEAVAPHPVDNPIDAAVGQMLHFYESFRSGAAEIAPPAPI